MLLVLPPLRLTDLGAWSTHRVGQDFQTASHTKNSDKAQVQDETEKEWDAECGWEKFPLICPCGNLSLASAMQNGPSEMSKVAKQASLICYLEEIDTF